MNQEFQVHILAQNGIDKAQEIAAVFDTALNQLKEICPESRSFSIVKTKLEEACFFAKKAMASDPTNQKVEPANTDTTEEAKGQEQAA